MAATSKETGRKISKLLFIIYLILLAYFLFFAESMGRTSNTGYRYNLKLFCEIKRFLYHIDVLGWKAVFINVFGNVLAFMPFGYFVPRTSKHKVGFFHTVLVSFEFSLLVECLQLVLKAGSFDVDDLFLNTVGGLLGYLVYLLIHGIRTSRKD